MAAKTSDPIDILLEMGIDLDNLSEEEDYLSALMEAANTLTIKDASDPRIAPLQQEILKLRKKRFNKARPEAKKTTIKPDAFFDKKKSEEQEQSVPGQKALPGQQSAAIVKRQTISPEIFKKTEEPEQEEKKKPKAKKSDPLKDILKAVNSILATLKNQNKITKKQAERDRKDAEKAKRGAQEDELETSPLKKFFAGAKKLAKPAISFFESIMKFIVNVLIGRLLVKILTWMGDPKNERKMTAIMDFFKVTWPAFLVAFLAFQFGLGGFITGLLGLIGGFIPKLLGLIPRMLAGLGKLATGNPVLVAAAAGAALFALGKIVPEVAPETVETETDKKVDENIEKKGGEQTATDLAEEQAKKKGERNAFQNFFFGTVMGEDAEYEKQTERAKTGKEPQYKFNDGGKVPEPKYEGNTGGKEPMVSDPVAGLMVPGSGNTDTVDAKLTPGEIVMSKPAVEKYGADTFLGMNAAAGSTNIPKIVEGVQYANQGGMVSLTSNGGRPIQNKRMEKGKTYNFNDLMPHSHNPTTTTYHDGIKMGPGKDYGVGTIPDYMPTGPNGNIPTPQSGKVLRSGDVSNGYGKTVVVDGPLGPMGFHHLSSIGSGIKQGSTINKGKIIGVQGATGGNYAEHLHLNASKEGHEAFVNFITSGKPTTGGGSVPKEETADFWALAAIMSVESGNAQGRADVAQSIMNRAAAGGVYPGGPSLLGLITAPRQYEPVTRGDASLWKAIKDKSTAIAALNSVSYVGGKGSRYIEEATKVLNDKTLMSNAAKFVGPRTDFSTPKAMQVHERYRDTHRDKEVERGGHVFGFFVGPGAVDLGKKQFASGAGAAEANFGNVPSSSLSGGEDNTQPSSAQMRSAGSSKPLPPPSRGQKLSDLYAQQEARAGRGSSSGPSASAEASNPGALNTPNSNDLPPIDANAMISMEKIKVLGLTVV